MLTLPLPPAEADRLWAVQSYRILDTPREEAFDRIVSLAAQFFDLPIAVIAFTDRDRQWIKASCGLNVREVDRDGSFSAHALLAEQVMVVEDACDDPRFAGHSLVVGEPHVRFYAGAPLYSPDGYNLGTLSVLDTKPRTLSAREQQGLKDLAATVVALLQLRLTTLKMEMTESVLQEVTRGVSATTGHAFFAPSCSTSPRYLVCATP